MDASATTRISGLIDMNLADLRAEYEKVFGKPTRSRNRKQLFSQIARQLQGQENGADPSGQPTLTVDLKRNPLDGWLRRKLRCVLWRQWKRSFPRAGHLMKRGLSADRAWRSATDGRGPWWNNGASHMNEAFPKRYFDACGLVSLLDHHLGPLRRS